MPRCAVCQEDAPQVPPPGWISISWMYIGADQEPEEGSTDYCGAKCASKDWAPDGTIGIDIPKPTWKPER